MDGGSLMAFTPNVVDGNIILASWGNELRDRSLQVFSSVAERDQQWAAPPNGAHCITLDTGAVWRRVGGVWAPMPGTMFQTGANTSGDVQPSGGGLRDTVTVTLGPAPYPCRISVNCATWFGNGTGQINAQSDLVRLADTAVVLSAFLMAAVAGAYMAQPLATSWPLAAGQEMGFKMRYNLLATTGNNGWYNARYVYQLFAT
jgi:hypothetical protein